MMIKNSTNSVCEEPVFTSVFKDHAEVIRNYIFYKCGDVAQAEDIMQEAFVKLWQNCRKVILKNAKAFLYKVAHNLFLNQIAHQKVKLAYANRSHSDKNIESPDFIMEEKEFMNLLQKALSELPEGQREVFLLNRIDKKTYKEIAELLGLSVKAIEKRMHNALQHLRKTIQNI